MGNNNKSIAIKLPAYAGDINYRERLLLSIIAKTVGKTDVTISGNDMAIKCSSKQQKTIQKLMTKHLPELDYMMEQVFLSHLHNYDLCTDEPINLTLNYA